MHKIRVASPGPTKTSNLCSVIFFLLIILLLACWCFSINWSDVSHTHADVSRLPKSSLFTYLNVSSQLHFSETQGILYVPLRDHPVHFASIKSKAVRGNHRHKDDQNTILAEVIILLQGQFVFRIGDGDFKKYEDYHYDVSKTGIVAFQFTADQCHALKNIGRQTNWFASYYIKSKETKQVSADRQGCNQMILT